MARSLDLDALTNDDLMRLVMEILNRLPANELREVRDAAEVKRQEKLDDAKNAVFEEMRGKLEGLGLTLNDVLPQRIGKKEGRQRRRDTARALPIKYRSPAGETWSGRGHVPKLATGIRGARASP